MARREYEGWVVSGSVELKVSLKPSQGLVSSRRSGIVLTWLSESLRSLSSSTRLRLIPMSVRHLLRLTWIRLGERRWLIRSGVHLSFVR